MPFATNQNGVTLVEMLVSIGFFSVFVFGSVAWMNILNKESSISLQNIAIDNVMAQSQYALGDTTLYCTQIIGRLPDNSARPFDSKNAAGISIPSIDFYDQTLTKKLANVATVSKLIDDKSGIILKQLYLKPISIIASGIVVSSLEFTFSKNSGSTLAGNGPSEFVREIPLYVTILNGAVQTCSTQPATYLVVSSLCDISNDGFATYNPATTACTSTAKWYSGPSDTVATCPVGTVPAVASLDVDPSLMVCQSNTNNGPPMPPRTYSDGVTDDSTALSWFATFDPSSSSCLFTYIVGTTPTPGAAQILCATGAPQ